MTELLHANGVNAVTGDYLLPPFTEAALSKAAQGEELDDDALAELRQKWDDVSLRHLAIEEGRDPTDLAQAGWGVIFAHGADPAVREALHPLLEHRRAQAGPLYAEYAGPDGYRPGESKQAYLARLPHRVGNGRGVGPGPADPEKVPYYLMIVGDPEAVPYRVQQQIDVQYAVGRVCFDTPEEYGRYARAVVAAESAGPRRSKEAVFFGVRNRMDAATQLSADKLITPLAKDLADVDGWAVRTRVAEEATKEELRRLLADGETPSLLFTASHGMGFPNGHPLQLSHQGALLCQDWPGPSWRKPIPPEFYLSADDLDGDTRVDGLIAFLFACYGAGTPKTDEFSFAASKQRLQIAPRDFVARLPQELLLRGALAVVGHVERAWGCSFFWPRAGEQLTVFESTFRRLMAGHPVGSAVEWFNERFAELSVDLSTQLEDVRFGAVPDDAGLSRIWTANNDARNYAVLGDPAVRLAV